MTRMFRIVGVAAVMVALAGCVPQEKYSALKLDRDGLAEQLGKSQTDASSARAEADSYKQQLAAMMSSQGGSQGLLANLQQQNANLQAALDELNRKYADAMGRVGQSGPLTPELNNALSAFAAQNPDLVDFDASRGVVKFKSDVTFALGDATLQTNAKSVIDRFATILNSSAASSYELLIAGHTDSTPVSNPRTIQAGHKDNWYLSAHRAISVGEELMKNNVNRQRIGVVGYADQHPIASNGTAAGQAQNRRVEVLILPTTVRPSAVAERPARTAPAARTVPQMNKDSATTDTRPVLNK